jgi:hypothetical protein
MKLLILYNISIRNIYKRLTGMYVIICYNTQLSSELRLEFVHNGVRRQLIMFFHKKSAVPELRKTYIDLSFCNFFIYNLNQQSEFTFYKLML